MVVAPDAARAATTVAAPSWKPTDVTGRTVLSVGRGQCRRARGKTSVVALVGVGVEVMRDEEVTAGFASRVPLAGGGVLVSRVRRHELTVLDRS